MSHYTPQANNPGLLLVVVSNRSQKLPRNASSRHTSPAIITRDDRPVDELGRFC
jgi:hypothetical protein